MCGACANRSQNWTKAINAPSGSSLNAQTDKRIGWYELTEKCIQIEIAYRDENEHEIAIDN